MKFPPLHAHIGKIRIQSFSGILSVSPTVSVDLSPFASHRTHVGHNERRLVRYQATEHADRRLASAREIGTEHCIQADVLQKHSPLLTHITALVDSDCRELRVLGLETHQRAIGGMLADNPATRATLTALPSTRSSGSLLPHIMSAPPMQSTACQCTLCMPDHPNIGVEARRPRSGALLVSWIRHRSSAGYMRSVPGFEIVSVSFCFASSCVGV
jgi:hypothetical protein